jgi:hypothetical protein
LKKEVLEKLPISRDFWLQRTQRPKNSRPLKVECSKAQIFASVHAIHELHFSDVVLTPFSGLVILQALFHKLRFKNRFAKCLGARRHATMLGLYTMMLLLIVHFMIGFCRLHDVAYNTDDPMVARVPGLRWLPSAARRCPGRCVSSPAPTRGTCAHFRTNW